MSVISNSNIGLKQYSLHGLYQLAIYVKSLIPLAIKTISKISDIEHGNCTMDEIIESKNALRQLMISVEMYYDSTPNFSQECYLHVDTLVEKYHLDTESSIKEIQKVLFCNIMNIYDYTPKELFMKHIKGYEYDQLDYVKID